MGQKELRIGMSDHAFVGIAHSQGNRLQVIANALAVLKRSRTGHVDREFDEVLEMACGAASQAGRLHLALLEHAFGATMMNENLDLHAALANTIALLRAANPSFHVSCNLSRNAPGILVNRRILEWLILSLIFAAGLTLGGRALEIETSLVRSPSHLSGDGECLHIKLRIAMARNGYRLASLSHVASDATAVSDPENYCSAASVFVAAYGGCWEVSSDPRGQTLHLYIPATATFDGILTPNGPSPAAAGPQHVHK